MLEKICIPISDELSRLEGVIASESTFGVEAVDEVIRYVTGTCGKRIRPAIFLLCAELAGCRDLGKLVDVVAAIELVHTASLMHDDVVDGALFRRGKASVHEKWGNQMSVLVGDFLWCRASQLFLRTQNQRLIDMMSGEVEKVARGEILELVHQNEFGTDIATYMEIIGGKTAALFRAAARAGVIVAGEGGAIEETLSLYGNEVGLAFQLVDDVLDYRPDEIQFGKGAGTDLKGGRITYPLIVSLARATIEEIAGVRDALMNDGASATKFREVVSVVDKYGGFEAAIRLAKEYANLAKGRLGALPPSTGRDALAAIADYVVGKVA